MRLYAADSREYGAGPLFTTFKDLLDFFEFQAFRLRKFLPQVRETKQGDRRVQPESAEDRQLVHNRQESERHQQVGDPTHGRRHAQRKASNPEWVDLSVDSPGHAAHSAGEESQIDEEGDEDGPARGSTVRRTGLERPVGSGARSLHRRHSIARHTQVGICGVGYCEDRVGRSLGAESTPSVGHTVKAR
ncbi:hypothetical protein GQ600_1215 [Phytophthora cactorum]|nr:hypothetical protein GQ600_1215 [Phytophthora cactorum]